MISKRKLILTFLAGLVIGAVLVAATTRIWCRFSGPRREFNTERILEKFNKRLHLNDQQKTEIGKILETGKQKIQALQEKSWPEFIAIRDQSRAEIRALLTPEQQAEFNRLCEEHDRKMKKKGPPPFWRR